MSKRSKHEWLVFSVYSTEIQNYPYYPFVAKSVSDGITRFLHFIEQKGSICEGSELHVIGTCDIYNDRLIPENIQPLIVPRRVEIKANIFSQVVCLSAFYISKLSHYLKVLKERYDYGKARKKD